MNAVAILAVNAGFALVGVALVHGLRGYRSVGDCGALLGFAYMLGVGVTVVTCSFLLIFGVPFGGWQICLVMIVLCSLGMSLPHVSGRRPPEQQHSAAEPIRFVGAAAAVLVAGYLALLVDLAPRLGMGEADAWTFWTPKAQAIWSYGNLHDQTFAALPGPTYPLFVPVLEAIGFHAMGAADTMVIHLQFALLLAGFVGRSQGSYVRSSRARSSWPGWCCCSSRRSWTTEP